MDPNTVAFLVVWTVTAYVAYSERRKNASLNAQLQAILSQVAVNASELAKQLSDDSLNQTLKLKEAHDNVEATSKSILGSLSDLESRLTRIRSISDERVISDPDELPSPELVQAVKPYINSEHVPDGQEPRNYCLNIAMAFMHDHQGLPVRIVELAILAAIREQAEMTNVLQTDMYAAP